MDRTKSTRELEFRDDPRAKNATKLLELLPNGVPMEEFTLADINEAINDATGDQKNKFALEDIRSLIALGYILETEKETYSVTPLGREKIDKIADNKNKSKKLK